MEAFALYLFRSVVWLTGFALVYLLFLRNERYFLLNRIYLLAGIVASIVFPFFTWHYTVLIPFTPTVEVSELQMTGVVMEPEAFPTKEILLILYMAGALYLLYRITRQTVKVIGVIRHSEILPYRSAKLIRTPLYPASFSFFSFVFVNPSNSETETREIVNHELEHVRQRHWIDLVLFELLCTLQWINPMCWLYGRFIRQNHEFLADQHALQRSANPAIYRAALINQLFGGEVISLANSFSYSINKKRFHMMKNTINPPIRKLKLLLILPIMAGVFYAFATPEYKYAQAEDEKPPHLSAYINGTLYQSSNIEDSDAILSTKTVTGDVPDEVKDTVKSSVTILEGNFIAPSPMGESSPVSGFRFSAKKIEGQSGKGTEIVKGEDISLDLGNTTSTIFIDGKEATKAEVDKLDPHTIASVSVLKGESATTVYGDKGKNGVILITLKKVENAVYTLVEQMPEFPGGEEALKSFIASSLKYHPIAIENGIYGQVTVSFIVDKTGDIQGAKIVRGVDPMLDQEALKVVRAMPKWNPGKQNGENVDVAYELPINFNLPSDWEIKSKKRMIWRSTGIKPEEQAEETHQLISNGSIDGKTSYTLKGSDYSGPVEIKIYDKKAKLLKSESKNGPTFSLSTTDLHRDVYYIYARAGSHQYTGGFILGKSTSTSKSTSDKKAEGKPTANQATQAQELIIVPNPTSDKATVTLKDSDYTGKLQVSVYDKDGKLIRKEAKNGPTFNLAFASYTSGNYFIVVKAGNNHHSGHLVVNH